MGLLPVLIACTRQEGLLVDFKPSQKSCYQQHFAPMCSCFMVASFNLPDVALFMAFTPSQCVHLTGYVSHIAHAIVAAL